MFDMKSAHHTILEAATDKLYWAFMCQSHVALRRSAFLDCANSMSFGHAALMMSAVNLACE